MQLAVNDLITRKQARSFGTLLERRATFEGLIPEVAKHRFERIKVRYRRLKKNTEQLKTLFALSNLWMVRNRLVVGA